MSSLAHSQAGAWDVTSFVDMPQWCIETLLLLPRVDAIQWITCLALTDSVHGLCFRGVPVKIYGQPTGHTKCEAHR